MEARSLLAADVGDTLTDARSLGVASTASSGYADAIGSTTDVDVYSFQASAGQVVRVSTSQPPGGTPVDTYLELLDSAGMQLAANDDSSVGNRYSLKDFRIAAGGTYFIRVSNALANPGYAASGKSGGLTGDYAVSVVVRQINVPPPPDGRVFIDPDRRVTVFATFAPLPSAPDYEITSYTKQVSLDGGQSWQTFVRQNGFLIIEFDESGVQTGVRQVFPDYSIPLTSAVDGNGLLVIRAGVDYTFRFAASNIAGTSVWSAPYTTRIFSAAGAPGDVVATPADGAVRLAWLPPVVTGDRASSVIEQSADGGVTWARVASANMASESPTSAVVKGLANGTPYLFRVAAREYVQVDPWSAALYTGNFGMIAATVTPQAGLVMTADAPTGVAYWLDNPGLGLVKMVWSAPAYDGGGAITDYRIEVLANGQWLPCVRPSSSGTSTLITALDADGGLRQFRVAAVNSAGTGPFAGTGNQVVGPINVRMPAFQPPVASAGTGTATVTWAGLQSSDENPLTDYAIEYAADNSSTWTPFLHDASTAASAVVTGLRNGTAYRFRIAGVNALGTGAFTPASQPVTPVGTATRPRALIATAGQASVTLTWSAPASTGGLPITDYTVQYSSDAGATWTTFVRSASLATTATVTGLVNGTSYMFRVAAVNGVGTGVFTPSTAAVVPATMPGLPTAVVPVRSNGAVTLTWSAPASTGGLPITDYTVQYSSDAGATWTTFVRSASLATTATVTGLVNGVSYVFRVAAVNGLGTGVFTAATAAVVPATMPGLPTAVVPVRGNGAVTLTWSAPASTGGSAIRNYVIQYSRNNGTTWTTFAHPVSAATSITVNRLANGVSYVFRIAAVNEIGAGAFTSKTRPAKPRR